METTLIEKKSTHKAEVVPFKMEPHPDADSLSIVRVWGYDCVVRSADWVGVDKAIYLVPDSVCDVRRPEFSFLVEQAKGDMTARIKAKRLRGVVSYGLLIPAPAEANIGDDYAERLGVTRYEPPEPGQDQKDRFVIGGEEEAGPDIETGPGKYDVDSFERYAQTVFVEGEPVHVSEKCDGSSSRFLYYDNRFWVKTRNRWVRRTPEYGHLTVEYLTAKGCPEEKAIAIVDGLKQKIKNGVPTNGFWQVLEKTPALMEYLKANPGTTVFGEIFGSTNRIKYGFPDGNRFAAFDIYKDGRFLDALEMHETFVKNGIPHAPVIGLAIPYDFSLLKSYAEGLTLCEGAKPKTIREGCVIRPQTERWDRKLGRVQLKIVSPDFLAGK